MSLTLIFHVLVDHSVADIFCKGGVMYRQPVKLLSYLYILCGLPVQYYVYVFISVLLFIQLYVICYH